MSAGQSHSLLLADGDCVQPVLLYCGRQKESTSEPREKSNQKSPRKAESYTVRPTLLPVCLEVCMSQSRVREGWLVSHSVQCFPVLVCRWATLAVCAAAGKAAPSWQTRTSRVLCRPSRSWPPERGSSTAGWVASGKWSSHQYRTKVPDDNILMFQTTNAWMWTPCLSCVVLCRQYLSLFRWPLHPSLFFSLWEFFSAKRPNRSTLHIAYLLPAKCTGPWRHLTPPAHTHGAFSGHLQRVRPDTLLFTHAFC